MFTGRRHLQVRLVEPSLKSLNSGDCFALVTEKDLFSWIGRESNPYEKAKVCKCMYFCMNCYVPFFLFLPSPLYLPLLIQLLLLMILSPILLFLLPCSANAVSLAANTATDGNSSCFFVLLLLLLLHCFGFLILLVLFLLLLLPPLPPLCLLLLLLLLLLSLCHHP